jgi:hypothetical protein
MASEKTAQHDSTPPAPEQIVDSGLFRLFHPCQPNGAQKVAAPSHTLDCDCCTIVVMGGCGGGSGVEQGPASTTPLVRWGLLVEQ